MNNIVNTIKYKKKEMKNTKKHLNNLVNINETNIILNSHKINVLNDTNMDTNANVDTNPTSNIYSEDNKFEYLNNLKNKIEHLDKSLHIKIFDILKSNNIEFSENRNGVFINLNKLDKHIINKINNFLVYLNNQEKHLNVIENIKDEINNDFFNHKKKDNKHINSDNINTEYAISKNYTA